MSVVLNVAMLLAMAYFGRKAYGTIKQISAVLDDAEYQENGHKGPKFFSPDDTPFHHGFEGIEVMDTTRLEKRIKERKQ